MTAFLARIQKWLGTTGLTLTGALAFLRDLDPMVQLALIGVVVLGAVGGTWVVSNLITRERLKHFLAGVK